MGSAKKYLASSAGGASRSCRADQWGARCVATACRASRAAGCGALVLAGGTGSPSSVCTGSNADVLGRETHAVQGIAAQQAGGRAVLWQQRPLVFHLGQHCSKAVQNQCMQHTLRRKSSQPVLCLPAPCRHMACIPLQLLHEGTLCRRMDAVNMRYYWHIPASGWA